MALYKPGDRVVVRDDLIIDAYYAMFDSEETMVVIDEMLPFRGKEVTIAKVNDGFYFIKEDDHLCYWSDDMFSGSAVPIEDDHAAWDAFFSDFTMKGAT